MLVRSDLSAKTLRRHLQVLAAKGVVSVFQSEQNRRARLVLLIGNIEERNDPMIKAITRRLAQARSRIRDEGSKEAIGESLMKEWLNLLIAIDLFTDNARPGFLVSPLTGDCLEYDRWYPTAQARLRVPCRHQFALLG